MSALPTPLVVVAALCYLAVTFYFGTVPSTGMPGSDHDKILHALCFGGMVVVSFPAANAWLRRYVVLGPWVELITAAYAVFIGALLEVVQTALPSRHGDLEDLAADSLGAACGYLLLKGAQAWRRPAPSW